MRKNIFLILSLIILTYTFQSCYSLYSISNYKVEKVYKYDNISQHKIFLKTLKWIALSAGWSKSVIDYQDSTQGTIIMKANIVVYGATDEYIMHTFQIDMKDNALKININNNSDMEMNKQDYNTYKDYINDFAVKLDKFIRKDDNF